VDSQPKYGSRRVISRHCSSRRPRLLVTDVLTKPGASGLSRIWNSRSCRRSSSPRGGGGRGNCSADRFWRGQSGSCPRRRGRRPPPGWWPGRGPPSAQAPRGSRVGEEAGAQHMALDDAADGCQQARDIAPVEPLTALGVEYGLELLHHKGDIAAPAEDGADHARERNGPGVVFEVLRIDEDFEGPPAPALHDVVNGDVDGVIAARPPEL